MMKKRRLSVFRSVSSCMALVLCTFHLHAQTETVTGIVTDAASKLPLIGASVLVKGAAVGITTDLAGRYVIKASPKAELIFSYLGYETRTVPVDERRVVNMALEETAISVQDVVVIGYGKVSQRELTGSASSLSSEQISLRAPTSIFDALQGMATGVQITSQSGEPGADSDIRIRGTSTFGSGTLPLYIVDGMPTDDIMSINPTDIGSVDILKDAASAAIYGSRAANGVIIITTKKGTQSRPKIDVRHISQVNWVSHLVPFTTPAQARMYDRERNRLGVDGNPYGTWPQVNLSDTLKHFYNSDGDLASLVFRPAYRKDVNLSVSGRSEKMSYYLSAAYTDEPGVVVNSGAKRITTRLNTSYDATPRFKLSNSINLSVRKRNGISEGDMVQAIYDWLPYWNTFDVTGGLMHNIGGKRNPYTEAMQRVRMTDDYTASSVITGVFTINRYLTFTSRLSAAFSMRRYFDYLPSILVSSTSGRTQGNDQSTLKYNYLNENFLNFNRTFCNNHTIDVTLGMSAQDWHEEAVRLRGYDYSTDQIYTLNAASFIDLASTYTRIEENSLASFFFRGNYKFKGRYILQGIVRYDGSSRFGTSNRWGAFPSVSAAWIISDENFMSRLKPTLDFAKLRIGYGQTGNESIGNYDAWQRYFAGDPNNNWQNGAYGGAVTIMGIAPIQLTTSNLGWEQTSQTDIGLDLGMFKSRLKVTLGYYNKKTTDLLYNVEIPKETGYTTMRANVGAMDNRGFEISMDYNVIRNKTWFWQVGFNNSWNNTVIKKLADRTPFYTGSNSAIYVYEGARLGEFWGYRHDGVFAYNESNAFDENWRQLTPIFENGIFTGYLRDGTPYNGAVNQKKNVTGDPYIGGDINWLFSPNSPSLDPNDPNYGRITEADKVNLGCAQPKFFGGVNSILQYKGFTLNLNFLYSIGGKIYNHSRFQRNVFTTIVRAPEPYVLANMWLYPGDVKEFPVPIARAPFNGIGPSDYWIEDGSYVRLRTIKLTYDLPGKWIKKSFLRTAQVSVYGDNLLTWSKYKGFDPEFGGTSPLSFGIDTGRYPRKLGVGFGINLGF